MANFSEMRPMAQWTIVIAAVAIVTLVLWASVYRGMDEKYKADTQVLNDKQAEVAQLKPYEARLPQLLEQIEALKQQMEIQKKIVPDEKEADKFIRLMQETASSSGIEIRRYTSRAAVKKEFYSEVPFEMEVDGPYYALLDFFSRTSRLERIVNIGNLEMDALKGTDGKGSRDYDYAPNESVKAVCLASTFFSTEGTAAEAPANTKGPAASKKKKGSK